MAKAPTYLLDVNAVVALLDEAHVHHRSVTEWFDTPGLKWALCPFTEAGVLRFFTRPKTGDLTMEEATAMVESLKKQPGYRYQPLVEDWKTLTSPFFKRLHGHNQVTDAYLLGLAVQEGLVLVTFDQAVLYMAGDLSKHVHLLKRT